MNIFCSAIIVASGCGRRMGSDIHKQFITINNKPILQYTIECFYNCSYINEIVIVVNEESIEFCKKELIKSDLNKDIKFTHGGKERQDSVYNGLKQVNSSTDIVLVHDGVRPFVTEEHIKKIIYSAYENIGAVLAVPVKDTIKVVNQNGFIEQTPKRETLFITQTPQGFKYDVLVKAYEQAIKDNFIATDDSNLVERLGYKIKIEDGSYDNIKITTKEDLYMAEIILSKLK